MSVTSDFKALHLADSGFIMPNAWDAGSAIILAAAGFASIATTSSGIAFSMGKPDYGVSDPRRLVSREAMFARLRDIVSAVSIPVSADLEAGYGDTPEEVARTIRMALEAGLAGCNIEDHIPASGCLYDQAHAVERITAAREVIDQAGSDFVLTARCDALFFDAGNKAAAIHRSNLYREAGADCLFTPGLSDMASIRILAAEIDGPLNMVMGLGNTEGKAEDWFSAGVQRISLGGSIARAALGVVQRAAKELLGSGTINFANDQMPQAELNSLFAEHRRHNAPAA